MLFSVIQERLGDLPASFLRSGDVFAAWQLSQALQLLEYCQGADGLVPQSYFGSADYGWLDVWGELFGIPRNNNEANSVYQARITSTLMSPVGTVYAIQAYSTAYFGSTVTVTENLPAAGYTISLPAAAMNRNTYLINLQKIRPAGVPFSFVQSLESFYFNTFSYFNGQYDGAFYYGGSNSTLSITIPEPIDNEQPLLPDILITDPILNGY